MDIREDLLKQLIRVDSVRELPDLADAVPFPNEGNRYAAREVLKRITELAISAVATLASTDKDEDYYLFWPRCLEAAKQRFQESIDSVEDFGS